MQENNPRNHIRNVQTGSVGSSSLGTVSLTCSTGETSSSSSTAGSSFRVLSAVGFLVSAEEPLSVSISKEAIIRFGWTVSGKIEEKDAVVMGSCFLFFQFFSF